jgi:hypothetical protein
MIEKCCRCPGCGQCDSALRLDTVTERITALLERIRSNTEAAPWVIAEIRAIHNAAKPEK